MKKLLLLSLILTLFVVILTACDMFPYDSTTEPECVMHVWSDYKYNYRGHWREYTCGCPWPEIVEEHINYDDDMLCDVCGAYFDCEHPDEDNNNVCDICGVDLPD